MRPYLIAEVASNHGGSVKVAKRFVDTFAPYVDAVKFQLTRVKHLRAGDPQAEWFAKAELSTAQFAEIRDYCKVKGVKFLLTVYNAADVAELVELGQKAVKIGSGEAAEPTLAKAVEEAGIGEIIVSCGIVAPERTLYVGKGGVGFLGCCTRYPAPIGLAASILCADSRLIGWSDHAEGIEELKRAASVGARVLEFHVQLGQQGRAPRVFEKTHQEVKRFREWLQEQNPWKFLGRWQADTEQPIPAPSAPAEVANV